MEVYNPVTFYTLLFTEYDNEFTARIAFFGGLSP